MSARQLSSVDVTAFRLAAVLEQYEQDVEELASTWFDAECHGRVSNGLDEMRLLCAGLPLLAVPWVHLLISHAEFMHCQWAGPVEQAAEPVACCKARHLDAVRALHRQCLGHFVRSEQTLQVRHARLA